MDRGSSAGHSNSGHALTHAQRAMALARQATGVAPVGIEHIVHDSYSHLTYKVCFDAPPHAVAVQFAKRSPDSVATSAAVLGLLADSLAVPEVLHLETGHEPALVTTWLKGQSLKRILPHLPREDQASLARTVAETAASIWSRRFPVSGTIGASLAIRPRPASLPDCVEAQVHDQLFHSPGGRALGSAARDRLWALWQRVRPAIAAEVGQHTCLVHGDLAARNLLVHRPDRGGWRISVLDWEFAVSGSPLTDVGHLPATPLPVHARRLPQHSRARPCRARRART